MGIILHREVSLNVIVLLKNVKSFLHRFEEYSKIIPAFLEEGHIGKVGKVSGQSPKKYYQKQIKQTLKKVEQANDFCTRFENELIEVAKFGAEGDVSDIGLRYLEGEKRLENLIETIEEEFVAILMRIKQESKEGEPQIIIKGLLDNSSAIFKDIEKDFTRIRKTIQRWMKEPIKT